MAYDRVLADRLRDVLAGEAGLSERRMFGGHAFLIDGHLAVSASGQGGLLLRVDPGQTAILVAQPHVEPFEMRGRELAGWLHVGAPAVVDDDSLAHWSRIGVAYARSLPAKPQGRATRLAARPAGRAARRPDPR